MPDRFVVPGPFPDTQLRIVAVLESPLVVALLSGLGLSASSGLNAYLPLLILALTDRISESFDLPGPYDAISSNAGIIVILLVMVIELVADKIPPIDHYNDFLHTPIRVLAGAICFMAVAAESDRLNVWVAGAIGLVVAGAVGYWKLTQRPIVTAATNGIGNPIVSLVEDVGVILVSIVAMAFPWGVLVALPLFGWWIHRTESRMGAGKSSLMHVLQPNRQP